MKIEETPVQYILDQKGKKKAVIIPLKEYYELLEDLHDLAKIAERRDEEEMGMEEVLKKLKDEGLIQG